jgi:site-specific recombinase XerC
MQERHQKRPHHRRQVNRHRLTRRKLSERYTPGSYLRAIYYACDQAFPPPPPLARIVNKQGKRESDRVRCQRLTKAQLKELHQWQSDHRWHPNQLRHNAATYLRKEFGIEAARVVLGHRSAGVTEIYAELDQEKAMDIIAKVG